MKIKNILIILLFIFITSCNKYEYVNDETRFNKQSGEIEKLSLIGEWNSLEEKLKENEKQRLRLIELKKQRTRQRDLSLKRLSWDDEDGSDIQYVGTSGLGLDEEIVISLINNSDYEIEMILTEVRLFDLIDGDSTLVSTTKDTLILDVDGTLGLPGNGEEDYCCFDFPDRGVNQVISWNLSIRGWKGF